MSSNTNLAILFVCVVIGLAVGLWAAFQIGGLADGAVFEFAGGLGTVLVTFGCCAAGVALLYFGVAVQIGKLVRDREKAAREERKKLQGPARKRRRKK